MFYCVITLILDFLYNFVKEVNGLRINYEYIIVDYPVALFCLATLYLEGRKHTEAMSLRNSSSYML